MLASMKSEEFLSKLNENLCSADWHRRYYMARARKYQRIDRWVKGALGVIASVGAALATSSEDFRLFGALLAGGCAFVLANILPNFKWDAIVSGLREEQEEWTRIFYGYEGLLTMTKIMDRGEILTHEFQKVEELRRAAGFNDRYLPEDEALLKQLEKEVRDYYGLDR